MVRFRLGTAQLQKIYGISNTDGSYLDLTELDSVLKVCRDYGINGIDTASNYEGAEEALGTKDLSGFNISSKIAIRDLAFHRLRSEINKLMDETLRRLRVDCLEKLYIHDRVKDLACDKKVVEEILSDLRDQGKIRSFGYSIYGKEDVIKIGKSGAVALQIPFNAFQQDVCSAAELREFIPSIESIEFRSIFLQGLLLMQPKERPAWSIMYQTIFDQWDNYVETFGGNRLKSCIYHLNKLPPDAEVVIGIQSSRQLIEILETSSQCKYIEQAFFHSLVPSTLQDPGIWPIK